MQWSGDASPEEFTRRGGKPEFLQFEEWPPCPACGGTMDFLASFDASLGEDSTGKFVTADFGDAGVGYVYACSSRCSKDGASFLWQGG